MSKMNDVAMTTEELRNATAVINGTANRLAEQFGSITSEISAMKLTIKEGKKNGVET